MSTAKLSIDVPNEGDGTHIQTQYGCRFPDGHIEWERWTDYSNVGWGFESLATRSDPTAVDRWASTLTCRAKAANIQLQTYIEDHEFLKRTVILVTTAPEEL